jgi:sugar phosphate isomerase/epimerase
MKIAFRLLLASLLLSVTVRAGTPLDDSRKVGGFIIGCEAYSFNKFTALEAIEKTKATGGKTIEFFSWEKFSTNYPKLEVNHTLPQKHIDELKAALKAADIRATSLYIGNNAFTQKDPEAALRKTFDFAKKLDLVALTGEPPDSGFDLVEKLCKEYDIKFCLHNHRGDESHPEYKYWNPAYTSKLMQGRDPRMGYCLDTGHLVRSGGKPLEAIKLFGSRLHTLHLKDPISATGHDTVYGHGIGDIKSVLAALKEQKFNGFISIEYETDNDATAVDEMRQCVDFVRQSK